MNKILKARMIEVFEGQWKFAAAIGEHEAVVSRVVREKIQLDPERKQKWASALGADVEKLFGKETTNGEA